MPKKELEKLLFKAVAEALGVDASKTSKARGQANVRDTRPDDKRMAA